MFNGKFFATLIGLIVSVLAIWYSDFGGENGVLENFINVPQTVKVMPLLDTDKGQVGLPQNYGRLGSNPMFMIPGNMQSSLSPRMSPLNNYGSYIRYNMPSEQYQGVPKDPLTFSNMVQEGYTKEGYCGSGGCSSVQGCRTDGTTPNARLNARAAGGGHVDSHFADPSYHAAMDSIPSAANVVSELPVPDMTMLDNDGSVQNPVVYDRFVYANQKSNLHGLGDYIRGDLAIKPCVGNWFNVSVHPHIDLNSGAMAVLGGVDNSTSQALYELQYQSSGTQDDTLGGVDLSDAFNVSAQKQGYQGTATNDLQFTAFP